MKRRQQVLFDGRLPGTNIWVDNFATGQQKVDVFFLSHFHRDHIPGLNDTFTRARIFCSQITRSLLLSHFPDIESTLVVPLAVGEATMVKLGNLDTCTVTAVDSNHCPGSVMFLFEGSFGTVLHTGDFRFNQDWKHELFFQRLHSRIDKLIFDATFFHPACVFPFKDQACEQLIGLVKSQPSDCRLYLAASGLGSEDLIEALFLAFKRQERFYVDPNTLRERRQQLSVTLVSKYPDLLTDDERNARFHLAPSQKFQQFTQRKMIEHKEIKVAMERDGRSAPESVRVFTSCICVKPSAMWFARTAAKLGNSTRTMGATGTEQMPRLPALDEFGVLHILYSMHSSFHDLLEFFKFLRPQSISPFNCPALLEHSIAEAKEKIERQAEQKRAGLSSATGGHTASGEHGVTSVPPPAFRRFGHERPFYEKVPESVSVYAILNSYLVSHLPSWKSPVQPARSHEETARDMERERDRNRHKGSGSRTAVGLVGSVPASLMISRSQSQQTHGQTHTNSHTQTHDKETKIVRRSMSDGTPPRSRSHSHSHSQSYKPTQRTYATAQADVKAEFVSLVDADVDIVDAAPRARTPTEYSSVPDAATLPEVRERRVKEKEQERNSDREPVKDKRKQTEKDKDKDKPQRIPNATMLYDMTVNSNSPVEMTINTNTTTPRTDSSSEPDVVSGSDPQQHIEHKVVVEEKSKSRRDANTNTRKQTTTTMSTTTTTANPRSTTATSTTSTTTLTMANNTRIALPSKLAAAFALSDTPAHSHTRTAPRHTPFHAQSQSDTHEHSPTPSQSQSYSQAQPHVHSEPQSVSIPRPVITRLGLPPSILDLSLPLSSGRRRATNAHNDLSTRLASSLSTHARSSPSPILFSSSSSLQGQRKQTKTDIARIFESVQTPTGLTGAAAQLASEFARDKEARERTRESDRETEKERQRERDKQLVKEREIAREQERERQRIARAATDTIVSVPQSEKQQQQTRRSVTPTPTAHGLISPNKRKREDTHDEATIIAVNLQSLSHSQSHKPNSTNTRKALGELDPQSTNTRTRTGTHTDTLSKRARLDNENDERDDEGDRQMSEEPSFDFAKISGSV